MGFIPVTVVICPFQKNMDDDIIASAMREVGLDPGIDSVNIASSSDHAKDCSICG